MIAAFNADMPFDQFTREQLAGDLLPGASLQQRVASGYNRLIMSTEEGGAQPKEYECKAAADRVRNLSAVWLGSTMQCCECHDHKFDPFSQRDFYNMEAFFADIQEPAIGPREAGMPVPEPAQQARLTELDRAIAAKQAELDRPHPELAAAQAQWEATITRRRNPVFGTWYHIGAFPAPTAKAAFATDFIIPYDVALGQIHHGFAWEAEPGWKDGEAHHFLGDNTATYLYRTVDCEEPERIHLSLGSDDTLTVWLNGVQAMAKEVYRGVAPDQDRLDLDFHAGRNELVLKITNGGGDYAYYFKASTALPDEIVAVLALPPAQRSPVEVARLAAYYRTISPALTELRSGIQALSDQRKAVSDAVRTCLVTTSGPPRRVTVKARGNWMDQAGAECQPAVPHFLRQLPASGRASRLDLANWLVSADNPLVARVLVNRLWQLLFGAGLVRTTGDFGTQGSQPSHPELLDALALDLVDHHWDVRRLLRSILLSSTYRQSSQGGAAAARDPDNLLLARQGRYRLDAEFVRDAALSISGLLAERLGGASVMPYQPAGYWMHLNFPPREWVDAQGQDQYRRGLYTHWQRTFLQPSLLAFDAPSREECCVERSRSNTPQQALVLLNDPSFLEAARMLAECTLAQPGDDTGRIAWAFRAATARAPLADESAILQRLLEDQRTAYRSHAGEAEALTTVGQHRPPAGLDRMELAAWTMLARALLNLGETYTRSWRCDPDRPHPASRPWLLLRTAVPPAARCSGAPPSAWARSPWARCSRRRPAPMIRRQAPRAGPAS